MGEAISWHGGGHWTWWGMPEEEEEVVRQESRGKESLLVDTMGAPSSPTTRALSFPPHKRIRITHPHPQSLSSSSEDTHQDEEEDTDGPGTSDDAQQGHGLEGLHLGRIEDFPVLGNVKGGGVPAGEIRLPVDVVNGAGE